MLPEQNISKFLEIFDFNNKVHARTIDLIFETINDRQSILEFLEAQLDAGKNKENIKFLLEKYKLAEQTPEECKIERKEEFSRKFNDLKKSDQTVDESLRKRPDVFNKGDSFNNSSRDNYNEKRPVSDSSDQEIKKAKKQSNLGIPGLVPDENSESVSASSEKTNKNIFKEPVFYQSKQNFKGEEIKRADYKPVTVNRDYKDTVFYQNILPETRAASFSNLNKDIDPVYLFPVLQCKLCGLRFGSEFSDDFGLHIEDHRRFTKALGEKVILRREYFSSKNINKMEKLDLIIDNSSSELVEWPKGTPTCILCKKVIKKVWNDNVENWVLDNGVKINDKEVAHKECVY